MSPQNSMPVFDPAALQQLRELVEGQDPAFLTELLESYVASAWENIDCLRQSSDEAVLRRAVHTLKGCSLNIGAMRVAELCKQLEQAMTPWPPSDLPQRVDLLENRVQQVADCYVETLAELLRTPAL